MKTPIFFLLNVFLPTVVGTAVYVGWRSTNLLVFKWLEIVGLTGFVMRPSWQLPEWALYSLPDGCWVYATTSWLLLIWGRITVWAWLAVIMAIGSEFGQLMGFVPGTYQTLDVIFYSLGFLLSLVTYEKTSSVNLGDFCNEPASDWKRG